MAKPSEMFADRCGTHPKWDMSLGDRCRRTREEAEELAAKRELEGRGPQIVTNHHGWLLKDVWFVQDERATA
jgi:hypothetical protein